MRAATSLVVGCDSKIEVYGNGFYGYVVSVLIDDVKLRHPESETLGAAIRLPKQQRQCCSVGVMASKT